MSINKYTLKMGIGLPFPENIVAVEKECGLQHHIDVSWEVSSCFAPMNFVS